jgi:cyclic peptide transporter
MIKKIKTIEFYDREYDGPKVRLFLAASIGGLSFALMLAVINQAAGMAADVSVAVELYLFLIYLLICSITIFCKSYTLKHTTTISNKTILKVRVRLVDKLRHSELQFLESTKKGDIYARIVQDTELIAQASPNLVAAFEAVLAGIAVFVYISIISFSGFIISLTAIIVMYVVFYRSSLAIKEKIRLSREQEADFLGGISDVLNGFKEIKVNAKKNNDLFSDIQSLSIKSEKLKTEAEISHDMNTVTGIMLYQLVLGTIVFIAPLFIDGQHEVIAKLVASVLFFFGISSMATRGLFSITRANVAVENLEKIDAKLDSYGVYSATSPLAPVEDFKDIALRSVSFRYPAKTKDSSFSVGPVDLRISQGEVIFIVGGNGSGKSTLMKILTGLYYPASGGIIELDGQPVVQANYQSYRELFSVIFTDFHLFKRLYGLEKVEHKQVCNLLEEMEIHTKTDFADGQFTKIDLSTGQRKRLAYIVALLEDKPILVFDEWAADQDSVFRKLFYEKFLDDLRAMNKTVIAVTHDDRYFCKADRIIKLDDGKIVEERVISNG